MVAWIADTAPRVLNLLPATRRAALRARLGLTDDELHTWAEMSRKMYVPFHPDGIVSQFEGYVDLEELDWERYRAQHPNIQRLDRILKAEGEDPDRYKLAKQADTVMLFFLFSDQELRALFTRLGYDYDPELTRRTIDYYDRRTSHGSTLSLVTHAGVLAGLDPRAHGSGSCARWTATSGTSRVGRPRKASTWVSCRGLWTCCSATTSAATSATAFCTSLLPSLDRLDGLAFSMQFRGTPLRVSIAGHELTVARNARGLPRTGPHRRRRRGTRARSGRQLGVQPVPQSEPAEQSHLSK